MPIIMPRVLAICSILGDLLLGSSPAGTDRLIRFAPGGRDF